MKADTAESTRRARLSGRVPGACAANGDECRSARARFTQTLRSRTIALLRLTWTSRWHVAVHTIAFGGRAFYNEEKAPDTCLGPDLRTPRGARREPGLAAEGLGEVRLAGEAEGEGDLAEGALGVAE